ncbi:MAG: XdhC family protein [Spirochaetaceae bacterium]|nr:XdhC family protein [Spirochaetaceae bacterium]
MRDIEAAVRRWHAAGTRFALARVVATWGSAPRRPGGAMAVTADLQVAGSLSGGCIEAAVIEEAVRLLAGERGPGRLEYGIEDERAWSVGLSCGGKLSVYLTEPEPDVWEAILDGLEWQRPAVLLTRLHDGSASHALIDLDEQRVQASAGGDPYGPDTVAAACEFAAAEQESGLVQVSGVDTFVHVLPRPDELLIVGAGHIAVHLVAFARELGFRTVVIDPRRVFATSERFAAEPDELLAEWPDRALAGRPVTESTYAVLLTHDPKIDDAALGHLLPSPAAYIGALGSSRTHARRRRRLQEAGFDKQAIDRIRGPAGLAIGAVSPDEIALAIMAQVIETKRAVRVPARPSPRDRVS